jgi:hypothetical protein
LHWCTAGKQASKQHTIQLRNKHLLEVEEQQMPFCILIAESCFRIFHKEVQHDFTA